ncbi:GDP-mannose-dependent alpha-(1-6)-phosphatidylinositol monomannoside mannosyltransferase [Sulfitobacter sp. THAF37]|uniref:glycosyltransferase family 4 protein n=1 Tax=Sulfitobacter sp. THAF37 TaxID=2587855 RepID=UPI001267FC5B|nr:glycosyltransferase family 4 protein [Sulfitobacter sp. THAF37]QFT60310.1 GDP-mannose-dependent alpha-(1-6)-phosphatidylinositol monomannoside mannosyltransferase [Sulfitobacter sp. THAF37]
MPELFVTNYNPNFTGVSATAANVIRQQSQHHDLALVGNALPGCPAPMTPAQAHLACRQGTPENRPFAIWHVRRNPEMRSAIWLRDVRRAPIRIVFTSAAQRLHSAYPRWLIRRMDAVIATTEKAAEFVPHVRAVVPHGVDTDLFTPAPDRAAAWRALGFGGSRGIATVGRIRPEKGTDVFVDAMLRFLPDHPDVTALVVGRAGGKFESYLSGLKSKVSAAGLTDRLRFVGEIPAPDLPALMRALSLVMQLPRYEGYGMVPLEGLASGTPFVGSETGYYRSFSDAGRVGTIVPLDNAEAAAAAAKALLERHDTIAEAARHTALTRFSARAEADGIDAVYQSLWHG